MALTKSSLVELVTDEAQGFALRSLGELTSQRQSIEPAMARRLLMNLFSIRVLFGFVGATRAVDLTFALSSLLERFQFGEIARGRAVLDLARRVFSRLVDIAVNLDSSNRSKASRTGDLEEELARMLNLERIPQTTAVLNTGQPSAAPDQLLPFIRIGHDEGRYVTLAVMNLLQDGENLPELLPILDSLSERGVLLGSGLLDLREGRARRKREESIQGDIAFFIFRTDVPWTPFGSFSRLPAMKLATLFDPVKEGTDGAEWEPTVPKIDGELVSSALAGQLLETPEVITSDSTALVPVEGTDVAVIEDDSSARRRFRTEKRKSRRSERRTTIGFKLVFITSIVLILSLTAMIVVASGFFRSDVTVRIEENNHTLAKVTALAVQRQFESIISSTQLFLNMVGRFSNVPDASQLLQNAYFAQNTGIAYIGIPGGTGFYNSTLLDGRQLRDSDIQNAIKSQQAALSAAGGGTTSVVNISPALGTEMLAIILPYRQSNAQVPLVIVTTLKQFVQIAQTNGITQLYAVDARGHLIIDPDLTLLQGNIDYSKVPIVVAMMKSPLDNGELQYRNSSGVSYLGSFKRTTFGGVGVIAAAPVAKAFEAVRAIERRNIYLEIVVLALSILVVYYFSKTITRPVGRLVEAARKVEGGHFLLDLKATTRDEIGLLTDTFVQMGQGLSERERIKDAFGKFVSKTMAEQVLQEEVSGKRSRSSFPIFGRSPRSRRAFSRRRSSSS